MNDRGHNNNNLIFMENRIKFPMNPGQIEIYQGFIDIGRRLELSEDTISKIKEDLHFDEVPTYPD